MLKGLTLEMPFKNEISRRFYDWCKRLIDNGEITPRRLSEVVGKYQNNPSNVLGNIKSGTISVPIEWIVACQKELGLNPCSLFPGGNYPDQPDDVTIAADGGNDITPDDYFDPSISSDASKTLHTILQKHNVKVEQYASKHLGISRQQLYKYLNGSSRLPFDLVQRVCDDLGESLDQFRTKPLPEGHLLERLRFLSDQVKEKDKMIEKLLNKSIDQGK